MSVLQTCRDLVNQYANFQMPKLVLDHNTAWIHCTTVSHDLFPFVCLKHCKQYFIHVKFLSAYKMWKVLQIIFGLTRHMCLPVPSQGLFQTLYVVVFWCSMISGERCLFVFGDIGEIADHPCYNVAPSVFSDIYFIRWWSNKTYILYLFSLLVTCDSSVVLYGYTGFLK
jgi:hypothetical protein